MRTRGICATALWLAIVIGGTIGSMPYAAAESRIAAYVQKDGEPYASPLIVDVLHNGGFTSSDPVVETDNDGIQYVEFEFENYSGDATGTIKLHLLSSYGEQVESWDGTSATESDGQIGLVWVEERLTKTVTIHLVPDSDRHPLTVYDEPDANTRTGDPVAWGSGAMAGGVMRAYSGDFTEYVPDFHVKGRGLDFVWSRRYLSKDDETVTGDDSTFIGNGWMHSYDIAVVEEDVTASGRTATVRMGNGRAVEFTEYAIDGSDVLYQADGWAATLTKLDEGDYPFKMRFDNGITWWFDSVTDNIYPGVIARIEDTNGNFLDFSYTAGKLTTIADTLGREYLITYSNDRISGLAEIHGLGRTIDYAYYGTSETGGNDGDLKEVTYNVVSPTATRTVSYTYSKSAEEELNGNLLTITDARGTVILTNTYDETTTSDSFGRVLTQVRPHKADAAGTVTEYSQTDYYYGRTDLQTGESSRTIVNDGEGGVSEFFFNGENQLVRSVDYDERVQRNAQTTNTSNRPSGTGYTTEFEWDQSVVWSGVHDLLTKETSPSGVETEYAYAGNQDALPLQRGHIASVTTSSSGATDLARSYTYHSPTGFNGLHLLATVADEEGSVTTYAYDNAANITSIQYPAGQEGALKEETFLYEGTNHYGRPTDHFLLPTYKGVTGTPEEPVGDEYVRRDHYEYVDFEVGVNSGSMVTAIIDYGLGSNPEAISVSTTSDRAGRRDSAVDGEGNTWSYSYTAFDELETFTSPQPDPTRGLTTPIVTAYEYDPNGNMTKATRNRRDWDNTDLGQLVTDFEYDVRNRQTLVTVDPTGQNVSTGYAYDRTGRQVTVSSPLAMTGAPEHAGNIVTSEYNGRGLLKKTTTPGGPTTCFLYDSQGRLDEKSIGADVIAAPASPDPKQQVYDYTYGPFDRIQTVTLPDTQTTTSYTYNKRGQTLTTTVSEANGTGSVVTLHTETTTYDAMGRVSTTKINAGPVDTTTTYTPAGQVFVIEDANGGMLTHIYDEKGRLSQKKEGSELAASYLYDKNNRLVQTALTEEAPGGGTRTVTADVFLDNLGRPAWTNKNGTLESRTWHDSQGNLRRALIPRTDPDTQTTTNYLTIHEYDALSRHLHTRRYNGATEQAAVLANIWEAWDANSRLTSRTDPNSQTTTNAYVPGSNLIDYIAYSDGGQTDYGNFDVFGRPRTTVEPGGATTTVEYDAMGRVATRTVARGTSQNPLVEGVSHTYGYDGLGRTTQITTGRTETSWQYVGFVDPEITPSIEETQKVDGVQLGTITKEYNSLGQRTRLEYPHEDRKLTYEYTTEGRLEKIVEGLNPATDPFIAKYTYAGMQVGKRELANGNLYTGFTFDAKRRIASVTTKAAPSGTNTLLSKFDLAWDELSNKTTRTETVYRDAGPLTVAHTMAYDGLNRMTEFKLDSSPVSEFAYDPAGNRQTLPGAPPEETYTVSGLHEYSQTPFGSYTYDDFGRLRDLSDINQRYIHDADGNLIKHELHYDYIIEHFDDGLIPADYSVEGTSTWTVVDKALQETSTGRGRIMRANVPADLNKFAFSYLTTHDPNTLGGEVPRFYGQAFLRASENASGEWTYIAVVIEPDRIRLQEWHDGEPTDLASLEVTSYPNQWYDVFIELNGTGTVRNDLVVSHGPVFGALTTFYTGTTTVTSGSRAGFGVGDQVEMQFDDVTYWADSISEEPVFGVEYAYDGLGRRVAKTFRDADGDKTLTYYVYDGGRVIEELNAAGTPIASYAYGLYIDEVLDMRRDTDANGTLDARYHYLQDDMHNVVAVVNAASLAAATTEAEIRASVSERYGYGAYGAVSFYDRDRVLKTDNHSNPLLASEQGNPYLFTGRRYDSEYGLYFYRTRYMDPRNGRFTARDTIGLWGDPNNLGNPYAYVGNNPWSAMDPFGLSPLDSIGTWLYNTFGLFHDERLDYNPNWGIHRETSAYAPEIPVLLREGRDFALDEIQRAWRTEALVLVPAGDGVAASIAFVEMGNGVLSASRGHAGEATLDLTGGVAGAAASGPLTGRVRGWLQLHEGAGLGHTIARHVGRSDAQLLARMATSNGTISGSSSFVNVAVAEGVIADTLVAKSDDIMAWLGSSSKYPKVLDYTSDITIGRGVAKGEDVVRDMSNAKVILKRNGQGWFYVLTAYPTK